MPFVFLLYALFASVFIIGKTGLGYSSPFFLVGSRMFFAGILMLAYQWWRHPETFTWSKIPFWRLLALGFFNIYLTNVCEFWGLRYLTSAKTCFFYSLSPFVSALLSYFILSERLTTKKWIGLTIGFIGFIPIMLSSSDMEELAGQFFIFSWAELAVLTAAVSSVYGWILLRQLVSDSKLAPPFANGMSMLIGGSLALLHSYNVEVWNPIPVTEFVPFFECALALLLISNIVCYNLYGWLLKRYSATFMSFAGFTTPLFTAFFGWFFLGEVVSMHFWLSFSVVLLGLTMFYFEELRESAQQPVAASS